MLGPIGAAAIVALAAASPAIAQGKDNGAARAERAGPDRTERRAIHPERADRHVGSRKGERLARDRDHRPPFIARNTLPERDGRFFDRDHDRSRDGEDQYRREWIAISAPACPPGLGKRSTGCLAPGSAMTTAGDRPYRDRYFGAYRPALFGMPTRARANYAYKDGYLIPVSGSGLDIVPLLGGALAAGRLWPEGYPNLPIADWQRKFFGLENPRNYRYADNVIYRVDPQTSAIQSVVALLTGMDFAVGQPMPAGYDVYNVPGPYRARYSDTDDTLYRYADGRVYEIDPATNLIARAIDLVT